MTTWPPTRRGVVRHHGAPGSRSTTSVGARPSWQPQHCTLPVVVNAHAVVPAAVIETASPITAMRLGRDKTVTGGGGGIPSRPP
jgi:hypothetical protein